MTVTTHSCDCLLHGLVVDLVRIGERGREEDGMIGVDKVPAFTKHQSRMLQARSRDLHSSSIHGCHVQNQDFLLVFAIVLLEVVHQLKGLWARLFGESTVFDIVLC